MKKRSQVKKHDKPIRFSLLVVFFLCITSFCSLFSSGFLDSEDGWLYASVARNIYYNHQISAAPNEYPEKNVHMNTSLGSDGVWRAPGSLGYSLSLVPAIALSDLFHKVYGAEPPQHFPLQHDWTFHLFASLTNSFFGGLFAVFMVLYAQALGFGKKYAFIAAAFTLLSTNLLSLTKYSFAHMMFITFLVASFYFIKRFHQKQQYKYIGLAATSYLLVALSYNVSFYLPIIPLFAYLLLGETKEQRKITLSITFILCSLLMIFFPQKVFGLAQMIIVVPKVVFEGVWGFLFSPGKSIFLYSPPLLLLVLFWHKMDKKIIPEFFAALLILVFYLYFLGAPWIGSWENKMPIWHGGMGWGPRYIAAVIPMFLLVIFYIVRHLSKKQFAFIVVPLFTAGFAIQVIGMSSPYLLQYRDLPFNVFIGKSEITVYDYASFIPRYTPLLTMTREFIRKFQFFPNTVSHGTFNVKFYDGFDVPHETGSETLRGFRKEGYISLSHNKKKPIRDISFIFVNVPDTNESSSSAILSLYLQDKLIQEVTLQPHKNEAFSIPKEIVSSLPEKVQLRFHAKLETESVIPHVFYIRSMKVNNQEVNLASLDYPDVSTIGSATSRIPYQYYGNRMKDPWTLWHLRHRINEKTFDFWWIKNLYFWDRPQTMIWGFFFFDVALFASSFYALVTRLRTNP